MVGRTDADVARLHPQAHEALAPLRSADAATLATLVGAVEDTREKLHRNVHPGGLLDDLLATVARAAR